MTNSHKAIQKGPWHTFDTTSGAQLFIYHADIPLAAPACWPCLTDPSFSVS